MGRAYQEWAATKAASASRGDWRTRAGGIDPNFRGDLPGYGNPDGWFNRTNPNMSQTQNLWEAAAAGMGMGNVGNEAERD